jgi:hypothetical protein
MPDDQLQNEHERQNRIRQCAYHLWEADGCPHGRDHEYWQRAEELIGTEDGTTAGPLPETQNEPDAGSDATAAEPQIDLEVSPDSATDRSARRQTPKAPGVGFAKPRSERSNSIRAKGGAY